MTISSSLACLQVVLPTMTASSHSHSLAENKTSVSLIGSPCGQHGQYTFYKAFKYRRCEAKRVLMLGEFFFLRISPHEDPFIGELQLLWEDRQRNQLYSSTRVYALPEQTPDGRLPHHGQVCLLSWPTTAIIYTGCAVHRIPASNLCTFK